MIKNKKSNIPVTILVIGVLAVCALTIFGLYAYSNNSENGFLGIGLIETVKSIEKEINFYNENNLQVPNDLKNFEKGSVKIISSENQIEGRYSREGKDLVRVIYPLR